MYLQELVEVAIGLIFAWLLLSIAVLQVQEVIATVFKKRAKDLESAIGNMLKDDTYLKDFYDHPLIQGLIEPISQDKLKRLKEIGAKDQNQLTIWEKYIKWAYTREETKSKNRKPSYIPAANFSAALFDVIIKAGNTDSPIQSYLNDLRKSIDGIKDDKNKKTAKVVLAHIQELGQMAANSESGSSFQNGLKVELKKQVALLGEQFDLAHLTGEINKAIDNYQFDLKDVFASDQLLEQVDTGIKALFKEDHESKLGKSMRSLLADIDKYAINTDKAIESGRKNVEDWFNNTMDRMGGWYKRWAQTLAFVIGFIAAVVFNIDSIDLAKQLWKEPALRQATASYVDNWIQKQTAEELKKTNVSQVTAELNELTLPIGWDIYTWDAVSEGADQNTKPICKKLVIPSTSPNVKDTVLFPPERVFLNKCILINNWPKTSVEFWGKFIGFFITAGAAMQGAPFWFDTLKKLVNIRGTGSNPSEKSRESTSDKER